MRVLVTGGCGFIGSHIVDELIERNHKVLVVDNLSTGKIENLNPKAELVKMDIIEKELIKVFDEFRPEVVYHEAAQIDIQKSIKDTSFDAEINILGTINVLESCRDTNVNKIIYASSAAVYGNPQYVGIDELHQVNPISYYGISKHTPEHYIKVFNEMYGLKYTILRYANVYGMRQDPKGEGGVVSIFLDRLLKDKQPTIFGDGEQTRDFIYVKDIASANIAALKEGNCEILNVGTNTPCSVNRLFEYIDCIMNTHLHPIYEDERKGDIMHSYLNNKKINEILKWKPQYSIEEGLKETIRYYKK